MKLKFNDFQQTTQEHVWPRLNKEDLISTARKTWDERRGGRGYAWWGCTLRCSIRNWNGSYYWGYNRDE